VAERPDLILYTGHGSLPEVDAVVTQAVKAGVKKILVNHPFYLVEAGIEDMVRWSKLGAYIEVNAVVFRPTKPDRVPMEIAGKILSSVPIDKIVLDSDYGQKGNGTPAEGLCKYIQRLIDELGVSEQQITMMLKRNPAKLLGLE
jgi:predicted metal-dependent phosphotriesterase family hydrolase